MTVKNLGRSTDIPSLARHIVATCQLIDEACTPELEQLFLYMQARKTTKEGEAGLYLLFCMQYMIVTACLLNQRKMHWKLPQRNFKNRWKTLR